MRYTPSSHVADEYLTVYIEGDGLAWINGQQPSSDPTPNNPLALRLALAQPKGNAAYLGRPCQYVGAASAGCAETYWTHQRFAPEVIESSSQALDGLKQQFGATHITLVGYSGGAAVALLLAARRTDIASVITVAGNLDHQAWTQKMKVEALTGSLNPADAMAQLQHIPQTHFAGDADKTIPPSLIFDFAQRFPLNNRPLVIVKPGYGHPCCWADHWPQLLSEVEARQGQAAVSKER
ncbi:alpha/beta hydrolase [Polaromonas sp. SM01]|uniref:alpha/beta hydrolase n=1 Tax=Polaromonas sp. SM01 TaxID=3085630 RepID=UPI002980FDDE|nr:alpha/beta hydrolase [Polaromonas sp. SM01]MDW5441780.1 alpha/beta hydrolase [Polaromonas sp. SM01]